MLLNYCDLDVCGYISLKSIIDSYYVSDGNQPTTQEVAKLIGTRLQDEKRIEFYIQQASVSGLIDVVGAIHKQLNTKGSTPRFRRLGAKYTAEKLLTNVHGWTKEELFPEATDNEKWKIGMFVLHVAMQEGYIVKDA